jgi:hypothetical protein
MLMTLTACPVRRTVAAAVVLALTSASLAAAPANPEREKIE